MKAKPKTIAAKTNRASSDPRTTSPSRQTQAAINSLNLINNLESSLSLGCERASYSDDLSQPCRTKAQPPGPSTSAIKTSIKGKILGWKNLHSPRSAVIHRTVAVMTMLRRKICRNGWPSWEGTCWKESANTVLSLKYTVSDFNCATLIKLLNCLWTQRTKHNLFLISQSNLNL